MALVRTGDGIIDIRGKLGGNVFSRDGSGLHCCSLGSRKKNNPSKSQKLQRNWYAGKKQGERKGDPPPEDYELPVSEHSAVIYSIEDIFAHRQPSLTNPTIKEIEYSGYWPDQITNWINSIYNPAWAMWGLSKEVMFLLTAKWFYVLEKTWGFGGDAAFVGAKANMLNFISQSASSVAVPFLSGWIALIGLGLYFEFLEWLEGDNGYTTFNIGRVLIRTGSNLYFGGLQARPSKKMYDFSVCCQTPFSSYQWTIIPDRPSHQLHWLYTRNLWQQVQRYALWYNVLTYTIVKCRYRGMAYVVDRDLYRLECDPSQQQYWGQPVGWAVVPFMACDWTNLISAYWAAQGDPHSPL